MHPCIVNVPTWNVSPRTEAKEVLTMDDYGAIRRARRDGKSIRQLAREFGLSRKTVRYVRTHSEPRPSPWTRNRIAPVLGRFGTVIDQILADDENAPVKQRHTAMQVFRRSVEIDRGNLAEHPAVKTLNAATIRYKAIVVELGLTPASRKAAAAGQASSDPLAVWRARVAGKGG